MGFRKASNTEDTQVRRHISRHYMCHLTFRSYLKSFCVIDRMLRHLPFLMARLLGKTPFLVLLRICLQAVVTLGFFKQ